MSLRSLTRVFKHHLVYFPDDKMYSVLPSKSGTKNAKGSKVVALYNGERWDAEICAVDDDPTKLHAEHRKIVAYNGTCEAVSDQPENESYHKENEPPIKKAKKSGKKSPVEKEKEKKKEKTKVTKELATVISRFDPATKAIDLSRSLPENTDVQPEQTPPSPEPTKQTPRPDLELPASPTEQPLPFPTEFSHQQSTPQLEFSFEVEDLTSVNISTDRIISEYLTSPPSRTENDKTSELVDLLKEIRSQNQMIVRKLDQLLSAEPEHPPLQPPARPRNSWAGPTQQLFPPPVHILTDSKQPTPEIQTVTRRPLFQLNLQSQELPSWEKLTALKQKSSSLPNFAVNCMRLLFRSEELEGRNIAGQKNKLKVDPVRVDKIEELVFKAYPTPTSQQPMAWQKCKLAMDEFIRRPLKVQGKLHLLPAWSAFCYAIYYI